MRFVQACMLELWRHIGPETDVPAGDIGVRLTIHSSRIRGSPFFKSMFISVSLNGPLVDVYKRQDFKY